MPPQKEFRFLGGHERPNPARRQSHSHAEVEKTLNNMSGEKSVGAEIEIAEIKISLGEIPYYPFLPN